MALYHTAAPRPSVVVVGVDTSLNVTTTATGTTSKAIEENTKPSIVVAVVTTVPAATAELVTMLELLVSWPPSPPLSHTQLLLLVVGSTGSVLSRALHFSI